MDRKFFKRFVVTLSGCKEYYLHFLRVNVFKNFSPLGLKKCDTN